MTTDANASPFMRRLLRGVFFFFLTFAVSLAVSQWVDGVLSEDSMSSAGEWQRDWYLAVARLAPLELGGNYLRDVFHVIEGGGIELTEADMAAARGRHAEYVRAVKGTKCAGAEQETPDPPAPKTAAEQLEGSGVHVMTRDEECRALSLASYCDLADTDNFAACVQRTEALRAEYEAKCTGWDDPRIEALARQQEAMRQQLELDGRQETRSGDRSLGLILLSPLAGLARTWQRLTWDGGWAYVWAILQLGIGLAAYLALHALDGSTGSRWPRGLWGWIIGVPVGTIVCASALAFVLKYLMLGGLLAFGWFTCFAATAAGAAGVAGFCWFLFVELTKHTVSTVVTKD